jgi:hypothetical protein
MVQAPQDVILLSSQKARRISVPGWRRPRPTTRLGQSMHGGSEAVRMAAAVLLRDSRAGDI